MEITPVATTRPARRWLVLVILTTAAHHDLNQLTWARLGSGRVRKGTLPVDILNRFAWFREQGRSEHGRARRARDGGRSRGPGRGNENVYAVVVFAPRTRPEQDHPSIVLIEPAPQGDRQRCPGRVESTEWHSLRFGLARRSVSVRPIGSFEHHALNVIENAALAVGYPIRPHGGPPVSPRQSSSSRAQC
jgi:hypothetical protein